MVAHVATLAAWEQHPWIIKTVGTFLVLLAAFIAGRVANLILRKVLKELAVDKHMKATTGYRLSLERQLSGLLEVAVYVAGVIIAASYLNILDIVLIIIGGALALFVLATTALALKDDLPNLIATIKLRYRKAFKPGDRIAIRNVKGEVRRMGLFTTQIDEKEDRLRIPNRLFLKEDYKVRRKRKEN
ncbi:mechanosensitive ion channel family protein [Candidatus Woesearchaeota archaeon]|nr:mechanosensitive ion channel family protein [Candidatus Woesearchaeota archaeon]